MRYKVTLILWIILLVNPHLVLSNEAVKKGVLIWFYSLEVKDNKRSGKIEIFKQTAGISYAPNIIHQILPLSPQSKITQAMDGNFYLDLAKQIRVTSERPLFLGQVLELNNSDTLYEFIPEKFNISLEKIAFTSTLDQYLLDRRDLQIHHQKIIQIRDRFKQNSPKILDYIRAVDQFVHKQLDYKKPTRPNTAIDLLSMNNGWCGEYSKLKQSLLRSAGIPTRGVYASSVGKDGPSVDDTGSSKVHSWLQSYIPDIGWVSIPSTRKINRHNQFVRYRGGYYFRAIDLYKQQQNIQKKSYSNSIKRVGGIRGNGMFFEVPEQSYKKIQSIASQILDYNNAPSINIINEIKQLPTIVQPLLYWFLISAPEQAIHLKASEMFIEALKLQTTLDLQMFYIISPTLVKLRIDRFLKNQQTLLNIKLPTFPI